jgi:prepilin-type N-terminal cleavage/methylation domain-containing protein
MILRATSKDNNGANPAPFLSNNKRGFTQHYSSNKKKGFTQHYSSNKKSSAGFTLVELLIVITISLIVLAVAVPIYGNLQGSAQINDVTSGITQAVRTARERSINRLDNSSHGVYIDIAVGDDSYILYQGDSYATRDSSYDRSTPLDSVITLSTTLTANDINFSKGLGVPNNSGTITITHDVNGSETITINSIGSVDLN